MRGPASITTAFRRYGVSFYPKRTYASFVNSITLEANQVLAVVRQPEVLSSIKSVNLRTRDTWPQWDYDKEVTEHQEVCQKEFLPILNALAASAVEKTTIAIDDILDLPVDHRIDRAPRERTPSRILSALGIRSNCDDIGLWTLPDLPAIQITHEDSRTALAKAREFTNEKEAGDGKATWRAFVAASSDPLYQAFDYTADFHSRDLDVLPDQDDRKAWVDLSPFGQGYHRFDKDCDVFGVHFAGTMEHNIEYFRTHEWKPGMYDQFRAEGKKIIEDRLGDDVEERPITSVKVNVPVWQLPEGVKKQCLKVLEVGEDEELVFGEYEIGKRKKAKDNEQ